MSYEEEEDIDHLIDEELVEFADNNKGSGKASDPNKRDYDEELEKATIPLADATVNTLRKHFVHGNVTMKRPTHGSLFSHCQASVPIAAEYKRLRDLLTQHACLELRKDIVSRIRQFEIFIRNLKKLVQEETASWQAINHSAAERQLEDHQTNLTALSPICDEFRMHLNHWICIKHRVHNNRWLRAVHPSLLHVMNQMCQQFVKLQETAFWWTEKLLKTGMQVFAYVDRRSLTYNDVFSIVRGIEEYNTLIQLVRLNTQEMKLSCQKRSKHGMRKGELYLVQRCQHAAIDSSTTKTLHFLRLLHSLASEWAKSAVAITRHFLDDEQALLESMQSSSTLSLDQPSAGLTSFKVNSTDSPQLTTSDYHSESQQRGDNSSGVDITSSASPLLDFGKKEREYISKVIQITCQRTTLLRKSKHNVSMHVTMNSSLLKKDDSPTKGSEAVIEEEPSGSFMRQDSKRKSVSWGDSHDMSVCRQLMSKYTDALWKAFGEKLEDSLSHELHWTKTDGHKSGIGCLDLCSSGAVQTFIETVGHAASKGYFTNSGSQQVAQVMAVLKARTNLVCCDVAISKCLSSMQLGKADAILLHDRRKSTHTAMLLRNAIMLARPQLVGSPAHNEPLAMIKGSPLHQHYTDCRIRSNIIRRLEIIVNLAEKWCVGKANKFLHSYKVAPFVVIVHGDMVVLQEELTSTLKLMHGNMFSEQVKAMQLQLNRLALFHTDMNEQLKKKASNLCLEILSEHMPRSRSWKSSSPGDELEVHSYAEFLVDQVLMPVAEGARHLCADDQLSAVDTVLNAVCHTWLEYFLKNKVKFSARGAAHLSKDFQYVIDFMQVHFTEESVRMKMMQSAQIYRFAAVLRVLSDQPSLKDANASISMSSRNRVAPMEQYERDQCDIKDRAQWASLRAGVPLSKSIFPCLPSSIVDGC